MLGTGMMWAGRKKWACWEKVMPGELEEPGDSIVNEGVTGHKRSGLAPS